MSDTASVEAERPQPVSSVPNLMDAALPPFHVVSRRKYWCLYVFTLGLYSFAWFYWNWVNYKRATRDERLSPGRRALFGLLFIHALGYRITTTIKRNGIAYRFNWFAFASLYAVTALVGAVGDRLAAPNIGLPAAALVTMVCHLLAAWALWRFQRAINLVCGDPAGASNARFDWVNWLWMLPGGSLLALTVLAVLLALAGIA